MQVLHKLENKDLQSSKRNSVLMKAFEQTSMSEYDAEAVCSFEVSEVGSATGIVRVKGSVKLHSRQANPELISKAMIYFPERKYGLEFIKETSSFTLEWVYEQREPKEYFNLVLSDKRGYILSSATYVFNATNIVAYPIREKDISPFISKSELIEDEGWLLFKSVVADPAEPQHITHTWQNVGQHVLLEARKNGEGEAYESRLPLSEMCSGIWMVIATDAEGKLMTQYVLQI